MTDSLEHDGGRVVAKVLIEVDDDVAVQRQSDMLGVVESVTYIFGYVSTKVIGVPRTLDFVHVSATNTKGSVSLRCGLAVRAS
jgi:hypothetical protein